MIIPRKADLSKSKHEKIRASTPPYELIIIIIIVIIKKNIKCYVGDDSKSTTKL